MIVAVIYYYRNGSFNFQMSMNASPGLAVTVEPARTCKEATDANVNQDFSGNTVRRVCSNGAQVRRWTALKS